MTGYDRSATVSERTRWFAEARFGMFIHWGLYSVLGHGEWAFNREGYSWREYRKLAEGFTASHYDPHEWARVARDAGMRYVVLTTKHHEGFCLWNSRLCRFNAVNSAARRDLLAEYVEAVREAGLKVGLYYSLGDWYHPDWARGWQGDQSARDRFMDYTHGLVRELMSNYGKIDILWYDLPQCYGVNEWRSVELNAMARSLQPHILINNRAMTTEDFATPEQHVAASAPGRLWESNMTLNDSWGYCPGDRRYKSPREVAMTLANVASGAGNLLLNVGPDGEGRIPALSRRILGQVGQWLRANGESIYPVHRHDLMWNLWGPVTVKDRNLYLHLFRHHANRVIIGGLTPRVRRAGLLASGQYLKVTRRGRQTILSGLPPHDHRRPHPVVKLELDGPPDQDISRAIGGADIFPSFPV